VTTARGYELVEVGAPLRERSWSISAGPGEAIIEVAGCGVCHTDLGYAFDGVRTRHALPLVLGHEISGMVVEVGPGAHVSVGQAVVVPAVIPCGQCDDCGAGRPMICTKQVMPGNDRDGGFATHVCVPTHALCVVPGVEGPDQPLNDQGLTLRHLAVVADAVSTPHQALVRAGVRQGDIVVVVGLGGVGGYAVQLARALGAVVVGLDVDKDKLANAPELGASLVLDPSEHSPRELRDQVKAFARERDLPTTRWTLMECSGTSAGQQTAYGMLVHGATLCVVGYTRDKTQLRLSNLMAFDAQAIGNWGCDPALYPDIVELARNGQIQLVPHTDLQPLHQVARVLDEAHHGCGGRRVVLIPGFES
jgi:6-hydroxycyclohex-1-ene-1-carbonyl-CoA dehydrogenase